MKSRQRVRQHLLITTDQRESLNSIADATARSISAVARDIFDAGMAGFLEQAERNQQQLNVQTRQALQLQKDRMEGKEMSERYLDNLADLRA